MEEIKKMQEDISIDGLSEEENMLRALCNECYELGEQGSHRMYNPHNFKVVLSKMLNK